ncbi:pyridoxal reductase [Kwoniella mangroviensis CBS 10435]|uniref:Pyridoxal reductase n=1 Tax=Kwoniella mangroviensis CBS 10435 TaxID=1331196 RepID=A0A1B9IZD4_9TREE|nr:pyridoxal reductase [Kwoniella mangroviensis CBS 10435]OCF74350.1 pyridoxal reductase [Kwoniella mangroviensis CBS 8886]
MSSPIPQVSVAGHQVGRMGYGLMQLTWTPTPPPEEESFKAIKAAADAGATCWSTATFYGPDFANIRLIANFFKKYPEYKEKIVLVVKGGADYTAIAPKGEDIEFLRSDLKKTQEILGDKKIDVYSLARLSHHASVEEQFTNLETLRKEGLFTAVGASEMGVDSLEKAEKITPIAIIEIEVSLFSFEKAIRDVVQWSFTNKVPIFAYSPLGRGFLTRTYKSPEDIPDGDFKKMIPRFQGEAFYENLKLVDKLDEIAGKKGVNTSQLALAWIVGLSDYTIPIPGSSKPQRAIENTQAANIKLTAEENKTISDILDSFEVVGTRYPGAGMAHLVSCVK